ncbi:MAG: DUF1641 domain-containing protein, partial [Bacteroidales bacterium]|nr:DUF1641 domain-containing protein [Bacteroidales bacterium]
VMGNIIENYSQEDVRLLSDNIVTILDTIKNLTQPEMLRAMNNAINVFKNVDTTDIKEYSVWKVLREMNSPEMKRGIGFMMAFIKNFSKENNE